MVANPFAYAGDEQVHSYIHAFARADGGKARALVLANFSDHEQTVDLLRRLHRSIRS